MDGNEIVETTLIIYLQVPFVLPESKLIRFHFFIFFLKKVFDLFRVTHKYMSVIHIVKLNKVSHFLANRGRSFGRTTVVALSHTW